jgi:hypothetical protein
MVAETSGYTAKDFLKFGGPLLLIVMVTCVVFAEFIAWGDLAWLS